LQEPFPQNTNAMQVELDIQNLQAKRVEYKLVINDESVAEGSYPYSFSHKRSAHAKIVDGAAQLARE